MEFKISSVWFLFKSADIGGNLPDLGAGGTGLVDPPLAFVLGGWVAFSGRAYEKNTMNPHPCKNCALKFIL